MEMGGGEELQDDICSLTRGLGGWSHRGRRLRRGSCIFGGLGDFVPVGLPGGGAQKVGWMHESEPYESAHVWKDLRSWAPSKLASPHLSPPLTYFAPLVLLILFAYCLSPPQ